MLKTLFFAALVASTFLLVSSTSPKPVSCGPNARLGCGSKECGKRCYNYDEDYVKCPKTCLVPSCECKPDFVFDDNIEECVHPSKCTPVCCDNEILVQCPDLSKPQNCSQLGQPLPIYELGRDGKCSEEPTCVCIKGYLRNEEGECVPKSECPPVCGANETYVQCPDNSQLQECSQLDFPLPIPVQSPDGKCQGKPSCVCIKGHLRNSEGVCVPECECPPVCCDNEKLVQCPDLSKPQNCSQLGQPLPIYELSRDEKCSEEPTCVCIKGYLRNEEGECVPKSECPPVCGTNETYAQCPDISQPQKCSQLGFPLPIPVQSPDGKCPVKPSCVCIKGHLRNSKGVCVPECECPSCGGDTNAKPGCDQFCKRCSNYKEGPVACTAICKRINGCECKLGFIFDDNTGKCVHPSKCTPVCRANETYVQCPDISQPQKCSQLGFPLPIPVQSPDGKCPVKPSCVCIKGHLRNSKGVCVPECECPSCGGDSNAKPGCDQFCKRCSNYKEGPVACTAICKRINGCECKLGFIFDDNTGKCVHPSKCTPVCRANETYVQCPDISQPQKCSQLGFPLPIPVQSPDGKCPVKPSCVCIKGHLRNSKGVCVPQSECPSCGGDSNAKPGCGQFCKRCSNYKKGHLVCKRSCIRNGCECKHTLIYDDNTGKCVHPSKCTQVCGANEIYVQCPDISRPQNCTQLGFPLPLPAPSVDGKCSTKPSCVCKEGYLKNKKGVCVPENDCPSCGGDPNAQLGCSQNCGRRCSNYKKGPVPCPKVLCKRYTCECKPDFVFDDNLRKCVRPSKCTPVCGANETYNQCPSISKPQYCSQVGYPLPVPKSVAGGQCQTKAACVCKKEGYVKNNKGICIPQSECPSCGGDPNAKVGCGDNCGRHCSNYNNSSIVCRLPCRSNSCICKPEFVYDVNIRKCVYPHECTPVCRNNEVFSDCTNGYCYGARYCTEKGKPVKCLRIDPKNCKTGCICKKGYLWNKKGVCVPEDKCETVKKCKKPNEVYEECPGTCPARTCGIDDRLVRCMKPLEVGDPKCRPPGCRCASGFFRNDKGDCVTWEQCPPVCGSNEVFSDCTNGNCFGARYCTEKGKPTKCVKIDPKNCKTGCICKKGYLWNKKGVCVPEDKCETAPVCGSNEVFSDCTNGYCFGARYCTEKGKPVKCLKIDPKNCKTGCICKKGYLWNKKGVCVPEDKCETVKKCKKPNEVYEECPGTCPARTCGIDDRLVRCMKPLEVGNPKCRPPGCRCASGFFRNDKGDCVTWEQCPPVCGSNEVFSDCTNGYCYGARYCTEKGKPIRCVKIDPKNCKTGCICKKGYLWNKKGVCVPEDKCETVKKCKKPNEVYEECPGTCPARTCGIDDRLVRCMKPLEVGDPKCRPPGCRCASGFYRNDKGDCVTWEQCPPVCGSNEVFSDCTNGYCFGARNCTEKGKPIKCVKIDPKNCKTGCICKKGYLWNKKGVCVPEDKCETVKKCKKPNEVYEECPGTCPARTCGIDDRLVRCMKPLEVGDPKCRPPGCRCASGFFRNKNGDCVTWEQCPPVCGSIEVFSDCTNGYCYGARYCTEKGKPIKCVKIDPKNCKTGCICKKGYLWNKKGVCVPEDKCETVKKCKKPNEVYEECPGTCPARTCGIDDRLVRCRKPLEVGDPECRPPGCRCASGFFRNDKGDCVTWEQCRNNHTCPKNEVFDFCPAKCPFRTCRIDDTLIDCAPSPQVGHPDCPAPSCRCADGFYRNDIGHCVPWKDCHLSKCKRNEVYKPCPRNCPSDSCDVDERLILCEVPPELGDPKCQPGCRCADGFKRNKVGECIPKDLCSKCTKPHEYYDPCLDKCSVQTCDDIRGVDDAECSCSRPPNKLCIGGCRCEPGYYKNKIGECISKKECLQCKGPHEYFTCGGACDNECLNLSKQNQTHCPIFNVDCNRQCYCESGYARDKNKICVPFKDCNKDCGDNEVYSTCTQAICRNQKCSEKGKPVHCPLIGKDCCRKGCVCKEKYLRNENGVCIPEDKCKKPPVCGPNEKYSSCSNLGCHGPRKCSEIGGPTICVDLIEGGCIGGCLCKKGFMRNDKDICIPEKECRGHCGSNEIFSNCTKGLCRNELCSQKDNPIACIALADHNCQKGCVCQLNYLRHEDGTCIPEDECDSKKKCPRPNEYYDPCPPSCSPQLCDKSIQTKCLPSAAKCTPACRCRKGFLKNSKGICVPEKECKKCSGPNEYYDLCPPSCSPQLCDKNITIHCPISTTQCIPGCRCGKGFLRNSKGICVPEKECTPVCGPNEEYSSCSNGGCHRPRECSGIGGPTICVDLIEGGCIGGCLCKKGFMRNDKGICIPEEECRGHCGSNEIFSNCTQGLCRNELCSQKDNPIACIALADHNCQKGCVCQLNYLRHEDGTCIPEDECDSKNKCPRPNEYYDPCPPSCSPQLCDKSIQTKCLPSITLCIPACRCRKGFLKNSKGICVPEKECNKCPGPNEYYDHCPPSCSPQLCDKSIKVHCPISTTECRPGCRCGKGFLRNSKGICVPEKECAPVCGRNEVYSSCTQGVCRNQLCSQKGKPVACPGLLPGSCTQGCVCKEKYLRAKNGTCIPEDKCEVCPPGEVLNKCPAAKCDAEYCPKDRNSPQSCISPKKCGKPICTCGFNQKRDRITGKCIPTSKCPPFKCDGPNEEYKACPPVCPGQNCSDYINNSTCPKFGRIGIVVPCKPQCLCKKNYYRNSKGICVKGSQCLKEKCPGPNQYYDPCPPPCSPQLCDKSIQIKCPSSSATVCTPACRCLKGFLKNIKGICVPEKECKPTSCKGDPNAVPGCGINCGRLCSNYDSPEPIMCIQVCLKDGCDCKEDFVLDTKTGKCIRPENCCNEPECKKNEVYSDCVQAECRPISCRDRNSKVSCAEVPDELCEEGCVCKPKYYRADNGTCVSEKECDKITPKCKDNEVFSNCTLAECRAIYCKDRHGPIACPRIAEGSCKKGCVCQPNYYRAENGTCVSEKECNRIECPKGGFFNPCPPARCDAEYCPKDRNSPQTIIATDKCGEARCTCGFDQKRDWITGKCINTADCPPFKCDGPNEEYKACRSSCPGDKCSDYLNKPRCPIFIIKEACKPRCWCKKNFYRNSHGICVKSSQCEKGKLYTSGKTAEEDTDEDCEDY